MEEEKIVSGYCRVLDQSRMVTVETESGKLMDVDCCYGGCTHQGSCLIARQIDELQKAD